ncbi:hypothetical protein NSA19_02945 [Actinomyces bowdenii]|uniref:hypothetical protein n=1 Tax=Actinomyces bowdenii TaxID=131109 RepID=UPI00214C726E|nr:hypothetical protein [Actinomyces bowdenii]MCR2051826.1 hypothetical protein [Actinomyces bowdenii]
MVKPNLWIDKRPSTDRAAGSQLAAAGSGSQAGGWVHGTVLAREGEGLVRVAIPADAPASEVVAPSDGGVTAEGARCVCLIDGTGRVTQVVSPSSLPQGATPWATGSTGRLALEAGAVRRDLDDAKSELESSQRDLASKIAEAERLIAQGDSLVAWGAMDWWAGASWERTPTSIVRLASTATGVAERVYSPKAPLSAGRTYRAALTITNPGPQAATVDLGFYTYKGEAYSRAIWPPAGQRIRVPAGAVGQIVQVDWPAAPQGGEDRVAVGAFIKPATAGQPLEGLTIMRGTLTDSTDLLAPVPTDRIIRGTALIPGSLLAEGTVGAREIVATEGLWAKIGAFARVTTEMLIAGGARITGALLADTIHLATRIVAGDEGGTHTVLDPTGLRVRRPLQGGGTTETVRLGADGAQDHLVMADSNGSALASISSTGVGAFKQVDVRDDIYLPQGKLSDLLASIPAGVLTKVKLGDYMTLGRDPLLMISASAQVPEGKGHRMLRVSLDLCLESSDKYTPIIYEVGFEKGTAVYGSTRTAQTYFDHTWPTNMGRSCWTYTFSTQERGLQAGDVFTVGVWGKTRDGNSAIVSVAPHLWPAESTMIIEDVGPAHGTVIQLPRRKNEQKPSTGTTRRTKKVFGSWGRSYRADGSFYTDGTAYQGYGGGPGRMSMIGFPDVISELSGATINEVWIYVYFQHWWNNSGGTASIGFHGYRDAPSTWSGISAAHMIEGISKPGGKWLQLPPSTFASWKGGAYKGITLRAPGDSTNSIYYGYAAPEHCALYIDYTK